MSAEEVSCEEISSTEKSSEKVSPEETSPKEVSSEGVSPEGVSPEGASSEQVSSEKVLQNLVDLLCDIHAIKFGRFITNSGMTTPVFLDLRIIISYPVLLDHISTLLLKCMKDNGLEYDQICAALYPTQPVATLIGVKQGKSMIMRRLSGPYTYLEGDFNVGQTCVIIDELVTNGVHITEAAKDLRSRALKVKDAVVILDMQQRSTLHLNKNNIRLKSLLTLPKLLDLVMKYKKISLVALLGIERFLEANEEYKLK